MGERFDRIKRIWLAVPGPQKNLLLRRERSGGFRVRMSDRAPGLCCPV